MKSLPRFGEQPPRTFFVVGLLALVLIAGVWWAAPRRGQPLPPRIVPPRQAAVPAASPVPPSPPAALAEMSPVPPVFPASNAFTTLEDYRQRRRSAPRAVEPEHPGPATRTPATELGRVVLVVRDYRAAFGTNPVGLNKEIVRALLGDNPRGAKFLDPATARLNAQGELLDDWGHPYFFHALSGAVMEVRSAGPDGRIFTPDDLVQ